MNSEDRNLGMDRPISRRDFVQGVAVASGATLLAPSGSAFAQEAGPVMTEANYPPLRHGLRGDHEGSYNVAHTERDGRPLPTPESTGETYDLVVVGGGLSGLAAAYFYRQRAGANARILVLDNHDDFGGHARRNEYVYRGLTFLTPGGSDYMVAPHTWTHECKTLLRELGLDIDNRLPRNRISNTLGLQAATFFRKEIYGKDQLVVGGTPQRPTKEFLAKTPLSGQVQADLLRLMTDAKIDYLPGLSKDEKIAKLLSMSYRDYLLNVAKIHPDAEAFADGVWCMGGDTVTAWFAYFRYRPGFAGLGVERPGDSPESPQHEADDFHTPAGNSDLARLMVRALIPPCLPPGPYLGIETAQLDYSTLDKQGSPARIRLSSTVIRATHVGTAPHQLEPDNREVEVTYVTAGKGYTVRAKDVVMAGMNNMIPYICPELPATQKAALHQAVRAVNQQTNVLFRNWEAFAKLKVSNIAYPGAFYDSIGLGARAYGAKDPMDPSQPVLVSFGGGSGILAHSAMTKELLGGNLPPPGTPLKDQFRMLRAGLLRTPFEHFERAVRTQAAMALAGTDFDPARDIVALTLNRWGHGFIVGRDHLFDNESTTPPCVVGRQKFGHITIANSDASGIDNAQTAIDEAFRAVRELDPRNYGYYESI
jgi:spermidine dehydrogenase